MRLPYKNGTRVNLVSPYGYRIDPITKTRAWHGGLDLVGTPDKTVCAVTGGTVIYSRMVTDPTNRTSEWGNYVSVAGDDGLTYYYCHLAKRLVSGGDHVEAGQEIGIEGSTGRSTGSHLHFEVRRGTEQINPADILGIPNEIGYYTIKKEEENVEEEKKTTDSEPSEWAKEAVEWAVENEIIFGTGDGDLKLRDNCTREQMIVFLHRFAQSIGKA